MKLNSETTTKLKLWNSKRNSYHKHSTKWNFVKINSLKVILQLQKLNLQVKFDFLLAINFEQETSSSGDLKTVNS